MRKHLLYVIAISLIQSLFTGCGKQESVEEQKTEITETIEATTEDMFTNRDVRDMYDLESATNILLQETSATADGEGVKIEGQTITITQEGTYVLTGNLSDGSVVIDVEDTEKIQLVLNGVEINSSTSTALYVLEADKVFVTLAEGTENKLANEGDFEAAFYAKEDVTLNGAGSLTVTSTNGHGIVCKDDLVFTGGTYEIYSAAHGVDANDSVRVANAKLLIEAGKDAIHVENKEDVEKGFFYMESGEIKAESEGDGIDASAYIQIEGGTIDILAGGGAENGTKANTGNYGKFMGNMGGDRTGMRPGGHMGQTMIEQPEETEQTEEDASVSMKGLKAENGIVITHGTINIDSADDGIHANTTVTINGGTMNLASGDDGIHADEKLTITEGKITIEESYEGLEALEIVIEGGEIDLVASDDGINAAGGMDASGVTGGRDGMFGGTHGGGMATGNGSILIAGGNLYIQASGDGIDANGTLEITGGYTVVCGPNQGDTATLDYDKSATITGGTFIGTGASSMAQTFSDASQGILALRVGNQQGGTTITITDATGAIIVEDTPELDYSVVIISTPELKAGENYTITVGSQSGEFTAN